MISKPYSPLTTSKGALRNAAVLPSLAKIASTPLELPRESLELLKFSGRSYELKRQGSDQILVYRRNDDEVIAELQETILIFDSRLSRRCWST